MAGKGGLVADKLVDEARARTGLADFGPDTWQEGLGVLVRSLNEEAALTPHGEEVLAARIVDQLVERLKFERSWREHPEIADEEIVSPVVGIGLGRTGSNALGFVMSQDPARRVLRMWEALFPSPPPETATEHSDPRIAATQTWIEGMWRDFPAYKDMSRSRRRGRPSASTCSNSTSGRRISRPGDGSRPTARGCSPAT